jgi:predicted transcriptional regulator
MLSKIAPIVARSASRSTAVRGFATAGEALTAGDAAKLSGYSNIEFRINEGAMVIDAVQQFAAHNIGCLVTVNDAGKFLGTGTLLLLCSIFIMLC